MSDEFVYQLEVFFGGENYFTSRMYEEDEFWAPITTRADDPFSSSDPEDRSRSREALQECVEVILENFENAQGYPVLILDEHINAVKVLIYKRGNQYWTPLFRS